MPGKRNNRRSKRRRRSRPAGCLLWVLALIVVLLVLSVLFGGFQRGSRLNGAAPVAAASYSQSDMNVLCGLSW